MPKSNIKPKVKKTVKLDKDENKLNKILDKIRPALVRDGGNLELISYDKKKGIVEVVLQGACAHCPLADVTLKHIIEAEIRSQMPEVKEVRAI
ncbi:MAG: NifU family protein [Patescibacteria group bacterium]|nr:NifU family protein [Patescibacteria group bacterium]